MPLHMNLGVIRQRNNVTLVPKTWYNVYSHSALLHLYEHNLLELLAHNKILQVGLKTIYKSVFFLILIKIIN